jgi:hypothetical protein
MKQPKTPIIDMRPKTPMIWFHNRVKNSDKALEASYNKWLHKHTTTAQALLLDRLRNRLIDGIDFEIIERTKK